MSIQENQYLHLLLIFSLFVTVFISCGKAQKGWHAVSPPNVTSLLGVCAGTTADEVYGAVNDNVVGPNVWHSVDMSNTGVFLPGGIINMDIAITNDGSTLCLVGPGGIFYGPSGNKFTPTSASIFTSIVTHCVEPLLQSGFAVVGRFKTATSTVNGVAVSLDKGVTWSTYDIGLSTSAGYYARYGSFPSATTWFVTSGTWPNGTEEHLTNGRMERISGRLALIYRGHITGQPWIQFISHRRSLRSYPGAISRTTDGGQTWQKVYDSNGQYYFNRISCYDELNCYAVGEGGKSAIVLSTNDSGNTWHTKLHLNGPFSIHAVQMISQSEIFTSGGTLSPGPITEREIIGNYYHSVNNGNTWHLQSFNGYGYDISFKDGVGYAATLFKRFSSIITYF